MFIQFSSYRKFIHITVFRTVKFSYRYEFPVGFRRREKKEIFCESGVMFSGQKKRFLLSTSNEMANTLHSRITDLIVPGERKKDETKHFSLELMCIEVGMSFVILIPICLSQLIYVCVCVCRKNTNFNFCNILSHRLTHLNARKNDSEFLFVSICFVFVHTSRIKKRYGMLSLLQGLLLVRVLQDLQSPRQPTVFGIYCRSNGCSVCVCVCVVEINFKASISQNKPHVSVILNATPVIFGRCINVILLCSFALN